MSFLSRLLTCRPVVLGILLVVILVAMFWGLNLLIDVVMNESETVDDFAKGILLTALAGVVTALLSFVGMVVKSLVDNSGNGNQRNSE